MQGCKRWRATSNIHRLALFAARFNVERNTSLEELKGLVVSQLGRVAGTIEGGGRFRESVYVRYRGVCMHAVPLGGLVASRSAAPAVGR